MPSIKDTKRKEVQSMTNRQEKHAELQKLIRQMDVYNWEHPGSELSTYQKQSDKNYFFQLALILRNNYQLSFREISDMVHIPVNTLHRELKKRSQKYDTLQDFVAMVQDQ